MKAGRYTGNRFRLKSGSSIPGGRIQLNCLNKLNQKLIFEFISISFAVFLGLMLNQWKDNYNNKKLANKSIKNIRLEINDNRLTVKKMLKTHKLQLLKVDSILTSLAYPEEQDDTEIDLNFKLINSTSWESAKLTQSIAFIDIEIVKDIAEVYEFQYYYEEIIKDYVLNNIYTKPRKRNRAFFENIRNILKSIIPMESNLIEYYDYLQTKILTDYSE